MFRMTGNAPEVPHSSGREEVNSLNCRFRVSSASSWEREAGTVPSASTLHPLHCRVLWVGTAEDPGLIKGGGGWEGGPMVVWSQGRPNAGLPWHHGVA